MKNQWVNDEKELVSSEKCELWNNKGEKKNIIMRINTKTMSSNRSFLDIFEETTRKIILTFPQSTTNKNLPTTTMKINEENIMKMEMKKVLTEIEIIEWVLIIIGTPLILIILYKLFNLIKKVYVIHKERVIKKYEKETTSVENL